MNEWFVLVVALVLAWGDGGRPGREWKEVAYRGRTAYTVRRDSTGAYLHADAAGQNSALFRALAPGTRLRTLAWRWRALRHPAAADPSQRSRDDRAAGVFVLVHRSWLPWRTRGLLYQWSPAATAGVWASSPYAPDIRVLTLRTEGAGPDWRFERRDVEADLRAAFGEVPRRLEAVGVLCDADNTRDRAAADFGELECVDEGEPEPPSER